MTALTLNFDRDLVQVGWMKGRKFLSMGGPTNARVRLEPGWERVYKVAQPSARSREADK